MGDNGQAELRPRTTTMCVAPAGFVHARSIAPAFPTTAVTAVTGPGGFVSPGFRAMRVTGVSQLPTASSVKTA